MIAFQLLQDFVDGWFKKSIPGSVSEFLILCRVLMKGCEFKFDRYLKGVIGDRFIILNERSKSLNYLIIVESEEQFFSPAKPS